MITPRSFKSIFLYKDIKKYIMEIDVMVNKFYLNFYLRSHAIGTMSNVPQEITGISGK